MSKSKKKKSDLEKMAQKRRTAQNKVKRIERALVSATSKGREDLLKALNYWKQYV